MPELTLYFVLNSSFLLCPIHHNYEYFNDDKCVYICLDARDYPCSKEHSGLEKKKADIEVLKMVCKEYGVCYN